MVRLFIPTVDVVWKLIFISFFAIPLFGIGQGLSGAMRSIFKIFVGVILNTGRASKVGCPEKVVQIRK